MPELGAAWFSHLCSVRQYLDSQSLGEVWRCRPALRPRSRSCCSRSTSSLLVSVLRCLLLVSFACTPVMKTESKNVSHLVVSDSANCSLPGSSVHGILQAGILERVAISFSRGSSQSRDQTPVSCMAGRFFTIWATREAPSSDAEAPSTPLPSCFSNKQIWHLAKTRLLNHSHPHLSWEPCFPSLSNKNPVFLPI